MVGTQDPVRVSRTVLRLLLLVAALAIAGAASQWRTAPVLEAAVGAGPAAGAPSSFESDHGPRQPAFFSVVRPPGLTFAGRVLENGPPTGGLRPVLRPFADLPLSAASFAPSRLRALERSRLEFAHDGAIARSGARSSFSTSLPPPLLA